MAFMCDTADGANPHGSLTLADGVLYGTTYDGGFYGAGTLFRVNLNGSGFTNLHNFSREKDRRFQANIRRFANEKHSRDCAP